MSAQKIDVSDIFIDDGEAKLSADYNSEDFGDDVIVLTMSNGGGFSSLYCTTKDAKDFVVKLIKFLDQEKVL